ncbi:MAG: hypothetical protein AB7H97_09130 [Pseudobdellovibrionaceae bacterium]
MDESNEARSIFIIKKDGNSMKQAEAYLKNRGWKVRSATALKQALALMLQEPPEFLLLCVENPHPKIRVMPKVLSQALRCTVIPFADDATPSSIRMMNELSPEFSLFPPVSGPGVERMVARILKKTEELSSQVTVNEKGERVLPKDRGSDLINITGKVGGADNEAMAIRGARDALAKMLGGSGEDTAGPDGMMMQKGAVDANGNPIHQSGGAAAQGSESQIQKGVDGRTSAMLDKGTAAQDAGTQIQKGINGTTDALLDKGTAAKNGGVHSQKGVDGRTEAMLSKGNDANSPGMATQKGVNGKTGAALDKGDADENPTHFNPQLHGRQSLLSKKEEHTPEYLSKIAKEAAEMAGSDEDSSATMDFFGGSGATKKPGEYDSILIKGTHDALEKTVIKGSSKTKPAPLGQSTNVACIIVQSDRFSGYLVVALGRDQKIDNTLLTTLKERLFKFLEAGSEKMRSEDQMQLKLEQVEFQSWAMEHAEFLRKSVHNGDEIAMAFFPHKEVNQKLHESASEQMLAMELDEIKGDVKMEFDVYVYLPENNKYVLYTPKGGTFYSKQKDRLVEKGVNRMHLKKESVVDVKRYRAQNYLNDKISQYKNKAKSKVA